MNQLMEDKRQARKRILWGVMLVAVGLVFMLGKLDILDFASFWRFWPLVLLVSGLVDVLSANTWKHISEGLNQIAFGAWLFVCFEHLWGLNFGNSWPLLLIAAGASIMLGGVADRLEKKN